MTPENESRWSTVLPQKRTSEPISLRHPSCFFEQKNSLFPHQPDSRVNLVFKRDYRRVTKESGRGINKLFLVVALGFLVTAVIKEFRKPVDGPHRVGKVAGIVPYDFRRPTLRRLIASVWSPDDQRILMPHAFGVGWMINLGRLVRLVRVR